MKCEFCNKELNRTYLSKHIERCPIKNIERSLVISTPNKIYNNENHDNENHNNENHNNKVNNTYGILVLMNDFVQLIITL